jgi:hypothetical protein
MAPLPLLAWVPADTVSITRARTGGGDTHLALGLCLSLRAEPNRQRGLDRILDLERVHPAQPWRVPECRDGSTHTRPPRDSGRVDMLGDCIRERLLSDAKSFGRLCVMGCVIRVDNLCELTNSTFIIKLNVVHGQRVCFKELDRSCMPRCEPDVCGNCYSDGVETHHSPDLCS